MLTALNSGFRRSYFFCETFKGADAHHKTIDPSATAQTGGFGIKKGGLGKALLSVQGEGRMKRGKGGRLMVQQGAIGCRATHLMKWENLRMEIAGAGAVFNHRAGH